MPQSAPDGHHSHAPPDFTAYVTRADVDALLAGYARVEHTHEGSPPEPEGTWLQSDAYPGVGLIDTRLNGFDFTVRRQNEPHAVINISAGAGPVADLVLTNGRIHVADQGSAPVIRVWEYAGFGTVRRVKLEDIHVTGPAGLQFLHTNVPGEVDLVNCTLGGVPVTV